MGRSAVLWLALALAIGARDAGAGDARTPIAAVPPLRPPSGGLFEGAAVASAHAMITERRQLDGYT